MCLTWQRQFFSRSCRLNVRGREAIGSREEPAGKMAAISLQPPVEVFPLLPFILSLSPLLSYRDLRKEPRSRNKGGESDEETLILINCLIFPHDVRDALPSTRLIYISLYHREDAVPSLFWLWNIHDIILSNIHCSSLALVLTGKLFYINIFRKETAHVGK